jgi:hypothetical protein
MNGSVGRSANSKAALQVAMADPDGMSLGRERKRAREFGHFRRTERAEEIQRLFAKAIAVCHAESLL